MTQETFADWDAIATNNASITGDGASVDVSEGCAPGNVNDAVRAIMAAAKLYATSQLEPIITTITPNGSVGTYDVTGLDDYSEIGIHSVGVVTSSAQSVLMRLGTGAGPTFAIGSTDYLFAAVGESASGGAVALGSSITLSQSVTSRNIFYRLYGFNKAVQTYCIGYSATGTAVQHRTGNRQTNEAHNALRLFIPSGTFDTGGAIYITGRKG